jgi:hypothetical protein
LDFVSHDCYKSATRSATGDRELFPLRSLAAPLLPTGAAVTDPPSRRDRIIAMLRDPSPRQLATLAPIADALVARARKLGPVPLVNEVLALPKLTPTQVQHAATLMEQMRSRALISTPVGHYSRGAPPPANGQSPGGVQSPGGNKKPGRPSDAAVKRAVKAAGNVGEAKLLAAVRNKYPGVRRDQVRNASENAFGKRPAHRPPKK